jgi:hypothetical protein
MDMNMNMIHALRLRCAVRNLHHCVGCIMCMNTSISWSGHLCPPLSPPPLVVQGPTAELSKLFRKCKSPCCLFLSTFTAGLFVVAQCKGEMRGLRQCHSLGMQEQT